LLEYFIQQASSSFDRILILRKIKFDNYCMRNKRIASLAFTFLELRCKSKTIPANDVKLFFNTLRDNYA